MGTAKYYPRGLRVDCPTHAPQVFEMNEELEMYVCPERDRAEGCLWVVLLVDLITRGWDGGEPIRWKADLGASDRGLRDIERQLQGKATGL